MAGTGQEEWQQAHQVPTESLLLYHSSQTHQPWYPELKGGTPLDLGQPKQQIERPVDFIFLEPCVGISLLLT